MYDVSENKSFQDLKTLLESIKGITPKDCIRVLIGNKSDVGLKRQVQKTEAEQLAKQLGVQYYEVSSMGDRQIINDIFAEVGKSELNRSSFENELF